MSETLKVFKNVHTQNAVGAAHSVTLASTSGTQRAVIKEVNCKGVKAATLDLDGRTVMTSTIAGNDLVASGNLIMDVNSVLSLKFPLIGAPVSKSFTGMMFTNGSDGQTIIRGTGLQAGTATSMTSSTRLTSSHRDASSSCAAIHPTSGALTFWRMRNGTVYEYIDNATANTVTTFNMGNGSHHGIATDGTYLYSILAGGTTAIVRRNIATGTVDQVNTGATVYGQQANQGSFLEYHKGYLYTKETGGASTMYAIKLSDGSVTTINGGQISGSYSDGGALVVTDAGKAFIMEIGTSDWKWYELNKDGGLGTATSFTTGSGGSSASTEYGDGGCEVAPGVAYFMCESSDDLTIIDMNSSPPGFQHISSGTSRNFGNHNDYGNTFSLCGFIQPEILAVNYDAYCSGVLVESV